MLQTFTPQFELRSGIHGGRHFGVPSLISFVVRYTCRWEFAIPTPTQFINLKGRYRNMQEQSRIGSDIL